MREAFEAWAQRDGHITRRREDKPDEYLVFETQRRWVIWQAALAHGQAAAESGKPVGKRAQAAKAPADEAMVRARVLNEVLDAFSSLDGATGKERIVKVIQDLKENRQVRVQEPANA
ncbi:hypothetical protein [Pseudoduganella sp. GCM10020061]|uniref:hypothetical protein n=1 Tax=Pseudoduganella sp. GCM10020061 TaxID=3317345 RepID=UPI00363150B0